MRLNDFFFFDRIDSKLILDFVFTIVNKTFIKAKNDLFDEKNI